MDVWAVEDCRLVELADELRRSLIAWFAKLGSMIVRRTRSANFGLVGWGKGIKYIGQIGQRKWIVWCSGMSAGYLPGPDVG